MKAHEFMELRKIEVDLEAIKRFRKLRGFSQDEMADQLGMKLQPYQRRETGKTEFSSTELKMVALTLGQPVDFFYTDYNPDKELPYRSKMGGIAFNLTKQGIEAVAIPKKL